MRALRQRELPAQVEEFGVIAPHGEGNGADHGVAMDTNDAFSPSGTIEQLQDRQVMPTHLF